MKSYTRIQLILASCLGFSTPIFALETDCGWDGDGYTDSGGTKHGGGAKHGSPDKGSGGGEKGDPDSPSHGPGGGDGPKGSDSDLAASPGYKCDLMENHYLKYICHLREKRKAEALASRGPQPMTGAGLFRLPDSSGILYSNGVKDYCAFTTLQTFQKSGMSQRPVRSASKSPAGFRNDGACRNQTQVGPGIFQIGPDIFYSNGVNAYCHIPTMDFFTNVLKAKSSQINLVRQPPSLDRHGDCRIP